MAHNLVPGCFSYVNAQLSYAHIFIDFRAGDVTIDLKHDGYNYSMLAAKIQTSKYKSVLNQYRYSFASDQGSKYRVSGTITVAPILNNSAPNWLSVVGKQPIAKVCVKYVVNKRGVRKSHLNYFAVYVSGLRLMYYNIFNRKKLGNSTMHDTYRAYRLNHD